MLTYLNQKKAQSTVEYAVLIAIIIGALLSIQMYIKRGVQGRLKSAADDIGDQFSPGNTNAIKATKTHSETQDTFGAVAGVTDAAQGVSKSKLTNKEITNTIDKKQIIDVDQEYWGSAAAGTAG